MPGVANKKLTLEDLTKEELIYFIKKRFWPRADQRELARARAEVLWGKAKTEAAQAINEMQLLHGQENSIRYLKANRKFDRAMAMYNEASKLLEEGA